MVKYRRNVQKFHDRLPARQRQRVRYSLAALAGLGRRHPDADAVLAEAVRRFGNQLKWSAAELCAQAHIDGMKRAERMLPQCM